MREIREVLSSGSNYCGRLLNYKKDGSSYWNLLTIALIKDEAGKVLKFIGMQVEVSKYTEGSKETMCRPNGLPESLIKYDATQKEIARSSLSKLVMDVKDPNALPDSTDRSLFRKSKGLADVLRPEDKGRRNSENATPFRRNSRGSMRSSKQKIDEFPEGRKKHGKSGFSLLMG